MNLFMVTNKFLRKNRFPSWNRFLLVPIPFAKGIYSSPKCQNRPRNWNCDSFGIGIGTALNASLTPALTSALTQALNFICLLNCTPRDAVAALAAAREAVPLAAVPLGVGSAHRDAEDLRPHRLEALRPHRLRSHQESVGGTVRRLV